MVNRFFGNSYSYRRSFVETIQNQGHIPAAIVFTPIVDQFFSAYPDSFGIFLLSTSLDFLAGRMRRRGETETEITKRLHSAEEETKAYHHHAKLFILTARITNDNDIFDVIKTIAQHYQLEETSGG